MADAYVAQMKGVLLSEGPPDLQLVDLSHALPRGDVIAGALFLEAAVPRFPGGTVHLVVVDPGVGSARRILVATLPDRAGGAPQHVVAPDNGLLEPLLARTEDARLIAIDVDGLARDTVSATFHGRDLMAPVAARLAWGMAPAALATTVTDPVQLGLPVPRRDGALTHGQVLHVDHFGNLITNLTASVLPSNQGAQLRARLAGQAIGPLRTHYAQVEPGELLLLWDSGGRLEIAVRDGSAADRLGVERHAEVSVEVVDVLETGG